MDTILVPIGFGNFVAMNRVIGMVMATSKPIKRMIQEAAHKGLLITLTKGRGGKTAIFIDTGHIVLTSLAPETITSRITD